MALIEYEVKVVVLRKVTSVSPRFLQIALQLLPVASILPTHFCCSCAPPNAHTYIHPSSILLADVLISFSYPTRGSLILFCSIPSIFIRSVDTRILHFSNVIKIACKLQTRKLVFFCASVVNLPLCSTCVYLYVFPIILLIIFLYYYIMPIGTSLAFLLYSQYI